MNHHKTIQNHVHQLRRLDAMLEQALRDAVCVDANVPGCSYSGALTEMRSDVHLRIQQMAAELHRTA